MLDIKRIAKIYGWVIATAVLAGGSGAALYTKRMPAVFEASAIVVVGPSDRAGNYEAALRSLDTVSRRNVMATYAQIPSSRTVREGVLQQLALSTDQAAGCSIRTSILPDTNVLRITVRGPSPIVAADFANAAVLVSQRTVTEIYGGIMGFDILDKALTPSEPVSSELQRKALLGALSGLFLSLGLVFLIIRLERKNRNSVAATIPEEQRTRSCLGQQA